MYILSRILKPGDVRIAALHNNGIIAVMDANGNIKLLIQNNETTDQGYLLGLDGKETKVKIPAQSLIAIVIEK